MQIRIYKFEIASVFVEVWYEMSSSTIQHVEQNMIWELLMNFSKCKVKNKI